jgi:hypothetical protein
MDIKALRQEAMEAATRFFLEHRDFLPSEESEEWEDEYRRQLALAKKRSANTRPVAAVVKKPAAVEGREVSGAPAQQRWAATIRAERLAQLQSKELRDWISGAWTQSSAWIDTRELAPALFLRRVEALHAEHRRQAEQQAAVQQAAQQVKAAADQSLQRELQAAGITAEGLVGLIDVSVRAAPAPREDKLAEITLGGRSLRIFEAGGAAVLMVIETGEAGRREYAIERDAGLVADLKLFARSAAPAKLTPPHPTA